MTPTDRRRSVGKLRTTPLTDEAHRALVLYVRQQAREGEEYDVAERMADAASEAVLRMVAQHEEQRRAVDAARERRRREAECAHEWDIGEQSDACIRCGAVQVRLKAYPSVSVADEPTGDPSEGAGDEWEALYGRWKR